jgi:putative flippase GtrA
VKKLLDKTFWKFILVGIANTLFGTAVMFLCYNLLGMGYWVSSAANYVFGSILSYFLNKHFTFRNKEKGFRVVARFVVNITVCYLIAYGLAKPLAAWALSGMSQTIQENGAMLVGMCFFVGLNYLGQRFFAFRGRDNGTGTHHPADGSQ